MHYIRIFDKSLSDLKKRKMNHDQNKQLDIFEVVRLKKQAKEMKAKSKLKDESSAKTDNKELIASFMDKLQHGARDTEIASMASALERSTMRKSQWQSLEIQLKAYLKQNQPNVDESNTDRDSLLEQIVPVFQELEAEILELNSVLDDTRSELGEHRAKIEAQQKEINQRTKAYEQLLAEKVIIEKEREELQQKWTAKMEKNVVLTYEEEVHSGKEYLKEEYLVSRRLKSELGDALKDLEGLREQNARQRTDLVELREQNEKQRTENENLDQKRKKLVQQLASAKEKENITRKLLTQKNEAVKKLKDKQVIMNKRNQALRKKLSAAKGKEYNTLKKRMKIDREKADSEIEHLKGSLNELHLELNANRLSMHKSKRDSMKKIKQLKMANGDLSGKYQKLEEELSGKMAENENLKIQRNSLRSDLQNMRTSTGSISMSEYDSLYMSEEETTIPAGRKTKFVAAGAITRGNSMMIHEGLTMETGQTENLENQKANWRGETSSDIQRFADPVEVSNIGERNQKRHSLSSEVEWLQSVLDTNKVTIKDIEDDNREVPTLKALGVSDKKNHGVAILIGILILILGMVIGYSSTCHLSGGPLPEPIRKNSVYDHTANFLSNIILLGLLPACVQSTYVLLL